MQPLRKLVLPKLCLSQKFQHAILYAPIKYGGRNFPNLFWEKVILHIDTLLLHASAQTVTGNLIIIELENMQLEVGDFVPVLNLDYDKFSYRTTLCWA